MSSDIPSFNFHLTCTIPLIKYYIFTVEWFWVVTYCKKQKFQDCNTVRLRHGGQKLPNSCKSLES